MKHLFRHIAFIASLLLASAASAAPAMLKVSLDSAYLLMGKVTPLHIELVTDAKADGRLVVPKDTMCTGVEILRVFDADTSELGSGRIQINRDIMLQSFDSGMYRLNPVLYISGHDTVESGRPVLKVLPAMVDSLVTIHDYADVQDVNRRWVDYLPDFLKDYGLWLLALVVVLGTALWLILNRHKLKSVVKGPAPKPVPPYEAAMQALEQLKGEHLCEQGREKDYYTILTEILRTYLQRRFGINAMEMTTDQIRRTLAENDGTRPGKRYVEQVLEIADFVKFAKMRPLPDDNVRAFNSARQFVEDTRPVPVADEADKESGDVVTKATTPNT